MRTLVISDLHLGIRSQADVLRRPDALEVLTARLDGIERLVLLGDTLELRHGPARDALAVAEPALRAMGAALGPGAEVVLAPGNHDHAIGAGWLDWRGRREDPGPLGVDERVPARHASWIARRIEGWLSRATVTVAYPGLWLREDVYATHGHYLDVHLTVPSFERLAAGVMGRLAGRVPDPAAPDDYEAQLAPLYAWVHAGAQRSAGGRAAGAAAPAVKVWRMLEGGGARRPLRAYVAAGLFPLAVAAANRAGLGPVGTDISGPELRRSALVAMAEVARRLRIAPGHLIFGHSHRTGMLAGDVAHEWRGAAGTQLHNCGSWVFETHFMGAAPAGESPYWPGGAIVLDAHGPPRLERLLSDVPAEVLRPPAPG